MVPLNKPVTSSGPVLTQREKKEKRKKKDETGSSEVEGPVSPDEFELLRSCRNPRDLKGKATVQWHKDETAIQVSTALPFWGSGNVSRHALAAGAALYGRKNLKRLKGIPEEDLARVAAQAGAWGFTANHFMALAYRRLVSAQVYAEKKIKELTEEVTRLNKIVEDKYNPENPDFQDEVFSLISDGVDGALNILRGRDGLSAGFEDTTFPDVFPHLADQYEDLQRKKRGEDPNESGDDSQGIEGEDEPAAANSNTAGQKNVEGNAGSGAAPEDVAVKEERSSSSGSSYSRSARTGDSSSSSFSSSSEGYSPEVNIDGDSPEVDSSSPAKKKQKPSE